MLQPKRTKYRKSQKMKMKGNAKRGDQLAFGSFGMKAIQGTWVTARQIEAARIALTRFMKREGQVWIRVFPDRPITKKGAETPMGKGKGDLDHYAVDIRPGKIIFGIDGTTEAVARESLRKGGTKLPITTKVVGRKLE